MRWHVLLPVGCWPRPGAMVGGSKVASLAPLSGCCQNSSGWYVGRAGVQVANRIRRRPHRALYPLMLLGQSGALCLFGSVCDRFECLGCLLLWLVFFPRLPGLFRRGTVKRCEDARPIPPHMSFGLHGGGSHLMHSRVRVGIWCIASLSKPGPHRMLCRLGVLSAGDVELADQAADTLGGILGGIFVECVGGHWRIHWSGNARPWGPCGPTPFPPQGSLSILPFRPVGASGPPLVLLGCSRYASMFTNPFKLNVCSTHVFGVC
jgi:hypothetical protein